MAYRGGTVVKNPPADTGDAETWIRSLHQEDPPEWKRATHSNVLAWEIPWTEAATVHGVAKTEHAGMANTVYTIFYVLIFSF